MAQPCCNQFPSLCQDPADPIANYSSEAPDPFLQFRQFYGNVPDGPNLTGDWNHRPGGGPNSPTGFGHGTTPEDALQDGFNNWTDQTLDENLPGGVPPNPVPPLDGVPQLPTLPTRPPFPAKPPNQPSDRVCNVLTGCAFICPDNSFFNQFVQPGVFCTTDQNRANRIAYSFACQQAIIRHICLSTLSPAGACLNKPYSGIISAPGSRPLTFSVFGSLPPGLSLVQTSLTSCQIVGTPTATGDFTFFIVATNDIGDTNNRDYHIVVVDLDTTLMSGVAGDPYSDTVEVTGPTGSLAGTNWFLTSGVLPLGLSLDINGTISGTVDPSAGGTYGFVLEANMALAIGGTFSCFKAASIEITSDPTFWWKFDSRVGGGPFDWFDEIANEKITSSSGNNIVLGILGNAMQMGNQHPPNLFQQHAYGTSQAGSHPEFAFDQAFTWTFWLRIDQNPSPALFALFTIGSFVPGPNSVRFIKDSGNNFTMEFRVLGVLQTSLSASFAYTLGDWFFVRMWYDNDNTEMGFQINNGIKNVTGIVPVTWSGDGSIYGQDTTESIPPFSVADWVIDEMGYWTFNIPDLLADSLYNGGAGKTCCPLSP